ncbi:ABC transporter permease [Parabacteroides sp. OttesenSCG-928-G06]|nr:ABC transporter permease [Parabacteroides sp. OttesenSCG-928-K15]MDL2282567.1 ABC transporter permease [Parabacteroides sp. OttesenSCG-928-G06]
MKLVSYKLIFRSWWRNKLFTVISVLSLAIGIGCTTLLMAFVVHEYNVEANNPERNNILYMRQDSPMKSGEIVTYVAGNIPPLLKEKYPEVEDYLRLSSGNISHISVDDKRYDPLIIVTADASFPRFFPYEVLYGDLSEALTQPGKIAIKETVARKLFGKENPLGKSITVHFPVDNWPNGAPTLSENVYQVAAVIKERDQSFLKFDALRSNGGQMYGGVCLIMTNRPVDREAFALQLKNDKVPTLQNEIGRYYFYPLTDAYFIKEVASGFVFLNNQQRQLLYIGLASSLLILLIACFNYINLNFSRLIQQVKMINTQKLMGATFKDIMFQLFQDTFLTVLIGTLISLLIIHDLLPLFNSLLSADIDTAFLFNKQVFPLLILFILLLSILPSLYISRTVSKMSREGYTAFFAGNRRKGIIATLSIGQFIISIGLIIATFTVNQQMRFIKQGGEGYKNLIEIYDWMSDRQTVRSFVDELRGRPDIGDVTLTGLSVINFGLQQLVLQNEDGSETYYPQAQFAGNSDFLKTFHIELLQGMAPEEAVKKYPQPVYINEKFRDLLVPKGQNPIGQPLRMYDKESGEEPKEGMPETIIVGVVKDFFVNSLEMEVYPAVIHTNDSPNSNFTCVYIRIDPSKPQQLATIRQIWEKHNPGKYFSYRDVYQVYVENNRKAFDLSRLLLMYALISIFLTCFGLFGMALYATEQRTKEIGVRKVNGATTGEIMLALNRQFVVWVGIAFLIAVPVAWLLLNRWLESFVYRVDISLFTIGVSGLIVLVITLLTVSWHSYKAASRNPVRALRNE